ncbi:MAG: hypothetical protein ACREXR_21245, partial [Gammaproteobacteria bacterium]
RTLTASSCDEPTLNSVPFGTDHGFSEQSGTPISHVGRVKPALLSSPGLPRGCYPPYKLALYEPTLFARLDAETPPPNEADAIRTALTNVFVYSGTGHD